MVSDDCKIIRHDPGWTPNDYEITFDPGDIPVNIPVDNNGELEKRLQKLMPLSKRIHIVLETKSKKESNDYNIGTDLKIKGKGVKFK